MNTWAVVLGAIMMVVLIYAGSSIVIHTKEAGGIALNVAGIMKCPSGMDIGDYIEPMDILLKIEFIEQPDLDTPNKRTAIKLCKEMIGCAGDEKFFKKLQGSTKSSIKSLSNECFTKFEEELKNEYPTEYDALKKTLTG